jgi:hypothetical protein
MGYVPKMLESWPQFYTYRIRLAGETQRKKIVIKIVVTMPRHKSNRQTTYHQRYNALSALEVHTMGKVQHMWTLYVLP